MNEGQIKSKKLPRKIKKTAYRLITGRPLKEGQLKWLLILLARPLVQRYLSEQRKLRQEGEKADFRGNNVGGAKNFNRLRTAGNYIGHGLQRNGEPLGGSFLLKLTPEEIVEIIEKLVSYFDQTVDEFDCDLAG